MSDLAWAGCHGVRLEPPELGAPYGATRGTPLAEARLSTGDVAAPAGGDQVWRITADVAVAGETVHVDQRLTDTGDDRFVLETGDGPVLAVDTRNHTVQVRHGDSALDRLLVTTFGIPLLLNTAGIPILHASSCARDGVAVLVVGDSGAGKSSLLVALVDAGWGAVSEDLCAISIDGDVRVWPGPPWVRRGSGLAGPAGSVASFHTPEKTAWDLRGTMVDVAVPVAQMVFLDPPAGDAPSWTPMPREETLRTLASRALWVRSADERAAAMFGPSSRIANAVPAGRLRVPVSASWTDDALAVVDSVMSTH